MKKLLLAAILSLLAFPSLAQVNRIDPNAMPVTPTGSSTSDSLADITGDPLLYSYNSSQQSLGTKQGQTSSTVTLSNLGSTTSSYQVLSTTGVANGTTTISSLASVAGLAAGQQITGSVIPPHTNIVSVGANSVVISNAATGSGSGLTFRFFTGDTYPLKTGGLTAPVINKTDFLYPSIEPTYDAFLADSVRSSMISGPLVTDFMFLGSDFEIRAVNWPKSACGSVYIDGALQLNMCGTASTAQAGGASTITLTAGASAVDNFYNTLYVNIVGGTGAGQSGLVTAYDGGTKVATVADAWSVAPDNTSKYLIATTNKTQQENTTAGTTFYPKFSVAETTVPHKVRIVSSVPIVSVTTNSSGTIWKPETSKKQKLFVIGDSFAAGSGSGLFGSYALMLAETLGMEAVNMGAGSTGFLANSSVSTNYRHRIAPPYNSWSIQIGNASGGTFTLTYNSLTTAALAYNISVASLQTAIDTTFGAGVFKVYTANWVSAKEFLIVALGANEDLSLSMTIASSLTGTSFTPAVSRWEGEMISSIPYDKSGKAIPFTVLLQGSVNDITFSQAAITAEVKKLISVLKTRYPQAKILLSGILMKGGTGNVPASGTLLTAQAGIIDASSSLDLINGATPYIPTYDATTGVGYLKGVTSVYNPAGNVGENSDALVSNDFTHPSPVGHSFIGSVFYPSEIDKLLGN